MELSEDRKAGDIFDNLILSCRNYLTWSL